MGIAVGVALVAVGSGGCGAKVEGIDDGGSSDGGSEGGSDGGSGGESDGEIIEDGTYVDCSSIPPGGPVVAPGDLGALGFPTLACNPRMFPAGDFAAYQCCSTDPAAPNGALPAYAGSDIAEGGTPLFSGANNDLGTWGMCVDTSAIPPGSGLQEPEAQNCPVPCNPTWNEANVSAVCGSARVCCQATELQMADCVQGEDGIWRAVTGEDIPSLSDWSPGAHATHQDPAGTGCLSIAAGDSSGEAFADCIAQLGAADQRGFCMALGPDTVCPHAVPSYVDACELLNQ